MIASLRGYNQTIATFEEQCNIFHHIIHKDNHYYVSPKHNFNQDHIAAQQGSNSDYRMVTAAMGCQAFAIGKNGTESGLHFSPILFGSKYYPFNGKRLFERPPIQNIVYQFPAHYINHNAQNGLIGTALLLLTGT